MASYVISIIVLFLLSITLSCSAQTYTNITRGTTFSTLGALTVWTSPAGDFSFGFHPIDTTNSSFLLAIWFNKTNPKTLIWFVYGETEGPVVVQPGSKFHFTADGAFSLTDQSGKEIWNPGVYNAKYAALLDTGNLVVVGLDLSMLWQSFVPCYYTLVPNQILYHKDLLQSRLTDLNYSDGRFQLVNQDDGDLVMYSTNIHTGHRYDWYWYTNTTGNSTTLSFTENGLLYFDFLNGTSLNLTNVTSLSGKQFYHRMTLDADGAFRHYVHPRPGSSNSTWPNKWSIVEAIPSDVCQYVTWKGGSGICGFNSYCTWDNASFTSACHCPPHYSFVDPTSLYKGCVPNFPVQSCEIYDNTSYDLVELNGIDWTGGEYDIFSPVSEDLCKEYCLNDCYCMVAFFSNGTCGTKRMPLNNGKMGPYVYGKSLIKVPKDNKISTNIVTKHIQRRLVVIFSLFGVSGLISLAFIIDSFFVIFQSCSEKKHTREVLGSIPRELGLNMRAFCYNELEVATDEFKEILGSGSYATVYKGNLASEGNTLIAVKKFDRLFRDHEKEFANEVRSIGQTYHKNLVKLFGYCNEGTNRLLVYEYMANGSLMGFLLSAKKLSWHIRVQIALGVAKGLKYLHDECNPPIIHCDIKPQNILLDGNFVVKIADFGLAKLLGNDHTQTSTGIRGTRGYIAPDWFKNVPITAKVDVYSFGVVLLEIICRRRKLEEGYEDARMDLSSWAYNCFRKDRMELLVENDEEAIEDMNKVERFVTVVMWCIQEDPSKRPSMESVTHMLEGTVKISAPQDPSTQQSSKA
ncbi:hypothetical protein LUZ60_011712 [Juncus effusus]|nr:hypothetical protein LUZ60_011712 [Juncus effusus]